MKPGRHEILRILGSMPDEAFGWFILACRASAMTTGANAQIWPDGMGGFREDSRAAVAALRTEAQRYIDQATGKSAPAKGSK